MKLIIHALIQQMKYDFWSPMRLNIWCWSFLDQYTSGLMQDCHISIALAMGYCCLALSQRYDLVKHQGNFSWDVSCIEAWANYDYDVIIVIVWLLIQTMDILVILWLYTTYTNNGYTSALYRFANSQGCGVTVLMLYLATYDVILYCIWMCISINLKFHFS